MNLDTPQTNVKLRAAVLTDFLRECERLLAMDRQRLERTLTYAYRNLIETGLNAIDASPATP